MIVLLDLDGTLVNTAHEYYKPYKDGEKETVLSEITLFDGALQFVNYLKENNHIPIIVSDSHPKYVKKIAEEIFDIEFISLTNKPNTDKTKEYLLKKKEVANFPDIETDKDKFILIGDTWLDIELGRSLNICTVLTLFYDAPKTVNRDGIGLPWKQLKSGATFNIRNYNEAIEIISNPSKNLFAIEAIFKNENSVKAIKFRSLKKSKDSLVIYRTLGRQSTGECDKFGVADKYFEFQREDRTKDTLEKLALATSNYILHVQSSYPQIKWDEITYVSDKSTTIPPNKLLELFDLIQTSLVKKNLIQWNSNFEGSIKHQKDYGSRKEFVDKNIYITNSEDLKGKNIIVIDDQFTTGGTARSICEKLKARGVENILFITLFVLISNVESDKLCPHCNLKLQIKMQRTTGRRFFSCAEKKFGGNGCGKYMSFID